MYCIFVEILGALAPEIVLHPDNHVNVMEGHSLEVNCSVKDSEHAEKWQIPYWKAQGHVVGTLHQNITSYNTVTLSFQRIRRSDAGVYSCSYNTSTSVISKNLFIIVDAKCKLSVILTINYFKEYQCSGWE